MDQHLRGDYEHIEGLLSQVKDAAVAHLTGIDTHRAAALPVEPAWSALPESGVGAAQAVQIFANKYEPVMAGTIGPRYWGFVTGGATPAALAGDWLTALYDQNPQSFTPEGDVSVVVEHDAVHLLRDLLGLPASFFGGFVTGATMSNFTGLAVARQWAGQQLGVDVAADGVGGLSSLRILSAVPHSCVHKDLAMLGLGRNALVPLRVLPGREAMDVADLEARLMGLEGAPCIVTTSGGTVNTVDFDDFRAIAALKQKYHFWWHIDAAFGAFAACSPDFSNLLDGWHAADSIAVDLHKWLNVPYDSAVAFVREEHQHLQLQTFQNANAAYLGDPKKDMNLLNFLPENSRRLRALPAWMTLMAYGRAGYQDIVERNVRCARHFGEKIEQNQAFQLLAPVRLNVVCFTLRDRSPEEIGAFLRRVNQAGTVYMTPTRYGGQSAIRAAFVNWMTTEQDVEKAYASMLSVL
jgi:glutamate/tyrosine decarboxylase-like PLP-dependent enzyme